MKNKNIICLAVISVILGSAVLDSPLAFAGGGAPMPTYRAPVKKTPAKKTPVSNPAPATPAAPTTPAAPSAPAVQPANVGPLNLADGALPCGNDYSGCGGIGNGFGFGIGSTFGSVCFSSSCESVGSRGCDPIVKFARPCRCGSECFRKWTHDFHCKKCACKHSRCGSWGIRR